MWRTCLVAVGGVVGSIARYWLAGAIQQFNTGTFPVGTLAVNLLGSFVVGLVMALSLDRGLIDADLRILLAIGLCGGFTTMSTFSYETMALLRDGEVLFAISNIGITVIGCLAAVWVGATVVRTL